MHKMVNGERVDLTPQEIAERQAEEAVWLSTKPLKDWESVMAQTDVKIPRIIEDIIDTMNQTQKDKLSAKTLEAYNEKKQRRAEKP
jgi:hypothetical protein